MMKKYHGNAKYTHSDEHGHLYYFELEYRADPPYTNQREVTAILDIADDGTLARIELIDNMPPPPEDKTRYCPVCGTRNFECGH